MIAESLPEEVFKGKQLKRQIMVCLEERVIKDVKYLIEGFDEVEGDELMGDGDKFVEGFEFLGVREVGITGLGKLIEVGFPGGRLEELVEELVVVSVVGNKLVELGVVLEGGLGGGFLETGEVLGDELREVDFVLCELVFIVDNLQLGEAVDLTGECFLESV